MYFDVECLLFLSEWLFLKVDLNYGTQLCLNHMLSCAWVIYTVVLESYYICLGHLSYLDAIQMILKKSFFQYFRKNVFTSVRIN